MQNYIDEEDWGSPPKLVTIADFDTRVNEVLSKVIKNKDPGAHLVNYTGNEHSVVKTKDLGTGQGMVSLNEDLGIDLDDDLFPPLAKLARENNWASDSMDFDSRVNLGVSSILPLLASQQLCVPRYQFMTFDSLHSTNENGVTAVTNVVQLGGCGGYAQFRMVSHYFNFKFQAFALCNLELIEIAGNKPTGILFTVKRMGQATLHVEAGCEKSYEVDNLVKLTNVAEGSFFVPCDSHYKDIIINYSNGLATDCVLIVDFLVLTKVEKVPDLKDYEVIQTPFGTLYDVQPFADEQGFCGTTINREAHCNLPLSEGRSYVQELGTEDGIKSSMGVLLDSQKDILFEDDKHHEKVRLTVNAKTPSDGNRAYNKMSQILNQIRRMDNRFLSSFDFLDLCAGPGNFSEYLLKCTTGHGTGVTLLSGPGYVTALKEHPNYNALYGDILTFDPGGCLPFDLVLADGSGFGLDDNNQESNNFNIIAAQTNLALSYTKMGGAFVLKLFGVRTYRTIRLTLLVARCFTKSFFFKPYASRKTNSEFYAIYLGYKGSSYGHFNSVSSNLNTLCSSLRSWFAQVPKGFINLVDHMNFVQIMALCEAVRASSGKYSNLGGHCGFCGAIPKKLLIPGQVFHCVCRNIYCAICRGTVSCPNHPCGAYESIDVN